MAESSKENPSLFTDNVVKAILPSDDQNFKKIVVIINSKYVQIGDENKIIGLDIPRRREETDDIPNVRCLDLNKESETLAKKFIQAQAVQLVNVCCKNEIEIHVNSDEASCLQIGDKCKMIYQDESMTEVNKKIHQSSKCRRQLYGPSRDVAPHDVMTGPVTRCKQRKRKTRKTSTSKKVKSTKQAPPAPVDCPQSLELCRMFFEKAQRILHPLRDNGNWSLFDVKWNELLMKYGNDPIWKALLKLEQGIRISYHSQFPCRDGKLNSLYLEEAEKTLCEGWELIKSLKDINPSIKKFFEGRYYCYLTSVYRRNKLHGRAQESIQRAEKIFQDTNSTPFLYDKATVFYEKGSGYHDFDNKGLNNKEAKESLQKCYELCQRVRKETGCDFIEKGHFALLKKVMVLLGCSTIHGRKRKISDEDLQEANKCINEFEVNQETHSIPVSEQMQLLLAKSDRYFRMRDFSHAEKMAHQAIDLADKHGFDSNPAKKRLHDIQDTNQEWPTQHNHEGKVETVDQRVSCDADGSSGVQTTGSSD